MNGVLETRTHCPACLQLLPSHAPVEILRVISIERRGRPKKQDVRQQKIVNGAGFAVFK